MDDADFDVGVAVKEDPSTSSTTGGRDGSSQISGGAPSSSSKKKKRRKKRKRSASEVSEGSQSVAFVTADVKVASVEGLSAQLKRPISRNSSVLHISGF